MAKVVALQKQEVNMEEALSQFLLFRKARGIADTTLDGHRQAVSAFIRRCISWEDVPQQVNAYMSEDIRNNTYNLRIKFLKPFFEFCVNEGYMVKNPFTGWKQRRTESRIVNIEPDTLEKLLAAPDQTTFSGLRDYAFLLLQLDTGIRPKEAMQITLDDIDFKQLAVSVKAQAAKTRLPRTLPIMPVTSQALRKLISARHPDWRTNLVFTTCEGKPLTRFSWGKRLAKYSTIVGETVRPYDLRHCFALYFLRSGGNVFSLQRIMGHANLSMTQKYIALTDSDIKDQHTQNSPLNTLTKSKRIKNLK